MRAPSPVFGRRSVAPPAARSEADKQPRRLPRESEAAHRLIDALKHERAADTDFLIWYQDAGGAVTERSIAIRALELSGGLVYVHALCRLRREPRSFRADRILEMANAETGEIVDHPNATLHVLLRAEGRETLGSAELLPDKSDESARSLPAIRIDAGPIIEAMRAVHAEEAAAAPREMPRSSHLALGALAFGIVLAFGLFLLIPFMPWWVYVAFALLMMAGGYKGLLETTAQETIIDGGPPARRR